MIRDSLSAAPARRNREGFTLVELLITLVLLGIVGAAMTSVLVNSFRVTSAQLGRADMQSNVRFGGLVLPLEFREMGYDSNRYEIPGVLALSSDIIAMEATSITFRAMRGWASTCDLAGFQSQMKLRKPTFGQREPLDTDGFLMFVENDFNMGVDDQWAELTTFTNLGTSTCGADEAIALNLNGDPIPVGPVQTLTGTNIRVGGPIRYFERMQFGLFVDADGRSWLGARSLSLGEGTYRAVAGPLRPGTGLQFRYFNAAGAEISPTLGNPALVRSIEVRLEGETRNPVSLMGSSNRQTDYMVTVTRVALRNTLTF